MAALSQEVLDNVANAALDYYERNKLYTQHISQKPLLNAMRQRQRTFPGGKEDLVVSPVFETQSQLEGFEGDDTLNFYNPTVIKQARYPWKMQHLGLKITTEELLKDGISIVNGNGINTTQHNGRDMTVIQNMLESKLDDMNEGYAAGMNNMLWLDGSQSTKDVPGIQYLISADPTVGVVGGIDRALQPLWRNIARTAANATTTANANDGAITPSTTSHTLIRTLQGLVRKLTRYGNPDHLILCGSAFLDALEDEAFSKGILTQTGFDNGLDVGIGQISLRGLGSFQYDPTLDDLGLENFAYFIDTKAIKLRPIEGEDRKRHSPARPHDRMVVYRSLTWAGGMTMTQSNTSMVVEANV